MIEPEHMALAKDDARPGLEDNRSRHQLAVDITDGFSSGHQGDSACNRTSASSSVSGSRRLRPTVYRYFTGFITMDS